MRHEVRLSQVTIADLLAIVDWIVPAAGPDVAHAYRARIEARCQTLAEFPARGRLYHGAKGLRSIPFERRATILYRLRGKIVLVVRILHAGRDVEQIAASLRS